MRLKTRVLLIVLLYVIFIVTLPQKRKILGAFGCGAFENNPDVVARAYKVALNEFPKVFKKITFAVYCSPKDSRNYEAFHNVLG